ncbi:hypothetical protein LSH36_1154g00088 [Paralvinella palmiformis]|uniref:Sodium-coupled monocarboxylate transporter 1 n=1 Tax=Paralvinella palmiformis TaxID=53620 RepID=A0AAD9MR82_9ANNE|nr:hypothetical protein LSH36_1154g00088 [Paralvinella palmiformis]
MSSEERSTFHWADYLVFALSLVASLAVGVYYAIKDRKKTNNEDYLMAGRSMSVIPVTASTFATLVSSIAFVAEPVEVYYFGLNYVFISLGTCLGFIPVAAIFAPTFHKLNLISAFSYFEDVFNPFVRKAASLLQIVLIGGMKAVFWASTIQIGIMFAGIIILCFKAMSDIGGWGRAMEIVHQGGRASNFDLNPNPFVRSGLWASLIGGFFRAFVPLTSTQLAIQRYGTLPTAKDVKLSVYLMVPLFMLLSTIFVMVGFAMYAHFAQCDPRLAGIVLSMDQYVPYLVMKVLGPWPGMPGLFVASLFAASLSTMSSALNGLAANILKDIVEPRYEMKKGRSMSEKMSFFVAKGLAFIVGLLVMGVAFLIIAMGGNLFMLINKIMGIFAGPICGLFSIAILMKSIRNVKAVIFGFLAATSINIWIGIGAQIYTFKPNILPVGIKGCFLPPMIGNETFSNDTIPWGTTTTSAMFSPATAGPPPPPPPEPAGFSRIYGLSPLYYSVIGYVFTVFFSYIADRLLSCIRKRRAKKAARLQENIGNDIKYKEVSQDSRYPEWTREDAKRLSSMPNYSLSKKEVAVQTLQSIPPEAKQDILWVYSQETSM